MLNYFYGTEIEKLAEHLVDRREQDPVENPLQPGIIIVQNHGMARWLSLYIARKTGIAANFKFEFPSERIWQLIRSLYPEVPRGLPEEIDAMTWAIMGVLEEEDEKEFERLRQYYREEDSGQQEMRLWMLSQRIAQVLDQYLIYRPEMLLAWEDRQLVTDQKDERWQSMLWRKLVNQWKASSEPDLVHRAGLLEKLSNALDSGTIKRDELPRNLTIFGVSSMPPPYLEMYVKLSKLIDVDFYIPDIAEQPHPENRNELKISFDKTGREYRELLQKFMISEGIEAEKKAVRDNDEQSGPLLFALKKHLALGEDAVDITTSGTNIRVHSCHSPRREVEVLYDQLLSFFEEDESLQPSDVLVLCPDLADYESEINAVFGNVEEGRPQIPFHLAEENNYSAGEVSQAMDRLLHLLESRFKLTDVLDLLDTNPIQEKFGLTDEHLNRIEKWVSDNRIRWGIDHYFKSGLGLPESSSFTWRAGLNRIMMGYAMKPRGDELFKGVYSYDEIEQSDDILLAGRFASFLNKLFEFHREVQTARTLSDWAELISVNILKFIPEKEEYYRPLREISEILADLRRQEDLSSYHRHLSYRTISRYLRDRIAHQKTHGGRTGQGVNFSSMVPMRNIPARVICLMGMNDGAFPRSKISAAFDLIQRAPKKGDRSHSDEDRQLFMESLLAAGDKLHISYVGQSNRQDHELPPSVVVRELLDYLLDKFDLEEQDLLIKHRLHSFSPSYYLKSDENNLFSYSKRGKYISENLSEQEGEEALFIQHELSEPEEEFKNLTVNDLVSFYQHPAKYLLHNRFGIYLRKQEVLDEDREEFQLDGLDRYKIGQQLLDRYLDEQSLESFQEVAKATDLLPVGWPGEQAYRRKKDEVVDFGTRIKNVLDQEIRDPLEVDLHIGEFRLTGRLDQLYKNYQLLYRYGKARTKYQIDFWIKHLVYLLAKSDNHPRESRFYHRGDGSDVQHFSLSEIDNPEQILKEMLHRYWSGMKNNMYFFPEASYAYAAEVLIKGGDHVSGIKKAEQKWKNPFVDYDMEGDDPYNKILYKSLNPLNSNEFSNISLTFWQGYLDEVQEVEL